tara:strand:- start:614 stop:1492 length:879 start_codon:yes stop_codon:yes gene_type:complete
MRYLSVFTLLFIIACGPGRQAAWEKEGSAKMAEGGEGNVEELATQAEEAWSKRADKAELEKAIGLWEQIVAIDPNFSAYTSLTRAYYLLGDGYIRFEDNNELLIATFEKGVEAGEKAMLASSNDFESRVKAGEKVEHAVESIPSDGIPAMYWYAANVGKFAVAKGFTTVLFYKDRIVAIMQRVLDLDENYFYAAPHRYFGAFYAKAPAFAGGDMAKSKEHFDKAVALAPTYFGTKVLYAEYYGVKAEDEELFDKMLNEVTEGDPNVIPELSVEQALEQKKAQALLAKKIDIF